MKHLLLVVVTSAFVLGCLGQSDCDDCPNMPENEVCEFGCRVISWCAGGRPITVECPPDEVVDLDTRTCRPRQDASPPCGNRFNCTGRAGRFPDVSTGCSLYYTCIDGRFDSTGVCPGGLVFDYRMQLCNWPRDVCVPCGTSNSPANCADRATTPPPATTPPANPRITPGPAATTLRQVITTGSVMATTYPPNCLSCQVGVDRICYNDCTVKIECVDGIAYRTTCNVGLVLDPVTKECTLIDDVCPPCGTKANCTAKNSKILPKWFMAIIKHDKITVP